MKRLKITKGLLIVVATFTVVLVAPLAVNAQTAQPSTQAEQAATQEAKRLIQTDTTAIKEQAQTRLADAKLKTCQLREKNVTNIMIRLSDRSTKQLAVFTQISDRTQAFYAEKGKILSNYAPLLSTVNTTKTNAETAVTNTKSMSVTFTCTGTDPKGVANSFKTSLQSQNDALKAYKTAIKNLIVGVKSVQSTTNSTNTTTSTGGQ